MFAMAEHEGWEEPSEKNGWEGTIAYRNHNPGNLRSSPFSSGKKDGMAVFKNDFLGFTAFQWDLMQKARGQTLTRLGPKSTLKDLIETWAPASDGNDVEAYVAEVVRMSGLSADMTLEKIFE